MSYGLTPRDFVQQVYYAQEKVVLDFWPTDDKYKEVLFEANLVLQELQNVEDWTWLRERLVLGSCHHHHNEIPEFLLPEWVYKPSTLYHDSLKLYLPEHHCHHGHCCSHDEYRVRNFIDVPLASTGDNQWRKEMHVSDFGQINLTDRRLRAIRVGDVITFNRPLKPREANRIAVLDVQRRLMPLHICNECCTVGVDEDNPISYELDEHGNWTNPCRHIERAIFTEITDPNYMVMQTAARHAEGSPPAQSRIQGLTDAAQRILSAMRQNDASATDADYLEIEVPGYVEVV